MLSEGRSNESFRAGKYAYIKYFLALFDVIYSLLLLLVFLGFGFSKQLVLALGHIRPGYAIVVPLYLLITFLGYALLSFPLQYYHFFAIEHQFKLSKQSFGNWLIDQLKAGLLSYCITLILVAAFFVTVRFFLKTWWLVLSGFWIFFSIVMARLLPVIIIPLFFKYKKLTDEGLRDRILKLAQKMKIKLMDCFVIDFSSKTLKANAALAGWGKTRRVILADTLGEKYTHDEIEVIMAHEFSHYKLKHIWKLMGFNALLTLGFFYLIYTTSDGFLRVFGLRSLWDVAALPVVMIYLLLIGIFLQPLGNFLSRKFEFEADRMALEITGNKEAFISMMNKLASQNLSDRKPSWLIKQFFFDHPPVDERIALAK